MSFKQWDYDSDLKSLYEGNQKMPKQKPAKISKKTPKIKKDTVLLVYGVPNDALEITLEEAVKRASGMLNQSEHESEISIFKLVKKVRLSQETKVEDVL